VLSVESDLQLVGILEVVVEEVDEVLEIVLSLPDILDLHVVVL
jgi:hypothetical protein